jgi:alpha-galactosidase
MRQKAKGLPDGVKLDTRTGNMTGAVSEPGTYWITLTARDAHGRAQKKFRLKVGDEIVLTLRWSLFHGQDCG